jgi:hypothetical protein
MEWRGEEIDLDVFTCSEPLIRCAVAAGGWLVVVVLCVRQRKEREERRIRINDVFPFPYSDPFPEGSHEKSTINSSALAV